MAASKEVLLHCTSQLNDEPASEAMTAVSCASDGNHMSARLQKLVWDRKTEMPLGNQAPSPAGSFERFKAEQ